MNQDNRHGDSFESPNQNNQTNQQPRLCEELEFLIPAHSIGATDYNEAVHINAQLPQCPQTAEALAEYGALATRLLYSASPARAPREIADRLRTSIGIGVERTTAPQTRRTRPALLRRSFPQRSKGIQNRPLEPLPPAMANYQLRKEVATPTLSTAPIAAAKSEPEEAKRPPSWYFGWTLATAAVLALLIINIILLTQNQELMRQSQTLAEQNQQLVEQQEAINHTLAQQNRALILLSAEEPQEVEIFDPSGESTAKADILWNTSLGIAVVYVRDFPECEAGMKYQLWLTKNGERSSGGLFSVDASGMGLLVVTLEDSLDTYDAIGITPEPALGSPGPTSPPIVRGEL